MQLELRNKDLWAGLMLVGIGAGSMFVARNYPFGTALRMGPGYFPVILGGLLVVFAAPGGIAGLFDRRSRYY